MANKKKERFLSIQNPTENVLSIKHISQITKDLRETLDNEGNLDAQLYLFFMIIIQDRCFVSKELGKRKSL